MDYQRALSEIERDGYTILRGVFPPSEVEAYRLICSKEFDTAPRMEGKIYAPGVTPNYVQPWMINAAQHSVASYRLYQFYHNELLPAAQHIVTSVIAIRDELEKNWPGVQEYNARNNLVDYNIVAKYAPDSGYQSRHADIEATLTHPALQCEILLTEPGVDYAGGDLLLHQFDGTTVSTNALGVHVGDLIIFDKRLEHEVTETKPVVGGKGRWMALIGAKTFPRNGVPLMRRIRLKAVRTLFLKAPAVHSFLKKILGKENKKDPFATY